MLYLWFTYDLPMLYLCFAFGLTMVYLCFIYLWFTYGLDGEPTSKPHPFEPVATRRTPLDQVADGTNDGKDSVASYQEPLELRSF